MITKKEIWLKQVIKGVVSQVLVNYIFISKILSHINSFYIPNSHWPSWNCIFVLYGYLWFDYNFIAFSSFRQAYDIQSFYEL